MTINEMEFTLKDGRKAVIRSPRDEDIQGMLDYLIITAGETDFLLRYPEDSAGSIMTVEYVDLKESSTVREAIERIRRVGVDSETINVCYVLDSGRHLLGTVALRYLPSFPCPRWPLLP